MLEWKCAVKGIFCFTLFKFILEVQYSMGLGSCHLNKITLLALLIIVVLLTVKFRQHFINALVLIEVRLILVNKWHVPNPLSFLFEVVFH